jgi:hypothetical protein
MVAAILFLFCLTDSRRQSQLHRLLPIKIPAYLDYFPLAVVVDLCLTVFNFPNLCFAFS